MTRPCALLLCLAVVFPLQAQTPRMVVPFTGSQAFCHILQHFRLQPLAKVADLAEVKAEETLVVIFGDTAVMDQLDLPSFLRAGGALLVATDRPDQGRLKPWHLAVDGRAVIAGPNWDNNPQPYMAYKELEQCPLLIPDPQIDHPIFQGMGKGLATNRPSFIRFFWRGNNFALRFPWNCRTERLPGSPTQRIIGLDVTSAYLVGSSANASPAGRTLFLAGHGAFMNGMMAQPDNDNFLFAWNCVRWLGEAPGENNKRKNILFVDDSRLVSELNVPLALPVPPMPPPTVVINRLLRGLEEENFFHRLLYHAFPGWQIIRFVILAFSVILLLLGARRLLFGRNRLDPLVPLTNPQPALAVAALTILAQRQQAQRTQDNYRETVEVLARQFFLEALSPLPKGESFSTLVEQVNDPDGPLQPTSGSWWERWSRRRQLRSWWALAGGQGGRIKAKKLRQLLAELADLKAALAAGDIQIKICHKR